MHSNTAGKHLGLALVVICAAQLIITLDATIVNVALPAIHKALHFSIANLEWPITAYSLTFGGLLLFGGRTGDLYGKRRMFMVGVALFGTASLLCGLATDEIWLIITRAVQGVGAAIAAPTALSLIASNFPEGQPRNSATGVYAAMSGAGGALGLVLGGVLTGLASWRWIFFVNIPITALILFLAPRSLNESPANSGHLDVPGALTATTGMLSLVYGLSSASTHGWTSIDTLAPLGIAAVLLITFVIIESQTTRALMPLMIFSNRNRTACYAMMLCLGTAGFSMLFFLSQFLQSILGWSPVKTGVGILPLSTAIALSAGLTSRLVDRIGIRLPLLVGPAMMCLGLAWMSRLTVTSHYLGVLAPLVIVAIGIGIQFVPLTLTTVRGVHPSETGLSSALLNTSQQIGGALGLSVLVTAAIDATRNKAQTLGEATHGHATNLTQATATTYGYTTAFKFASVIMLAGFLISLIVIRVRGSIDPLIMQAVSQS